MPEIVVQEVSEQMRTFQNVGVLYIVLGMTYLSSRMGHTIVQEKETKVREWIRVSWIVLTCYLTSWILNYFGFLVISSFLVVLILRSSLALTDSGAIVALFMLFIAFDGPLLRWEFS